MFVEIVEVFGDAWLSVRKFCECVVRHLSVHALVGEVQWLYVFGNVQTECNSFLSVVC